MVRELHRKQQDVSGRPFDWIVLEGRNQPSLHQIGPMFGKRARAGGQGGCVCDRLLCKVVDGHRPENKQAEAQDTRDPAERRCAAARLRLGELLRRLACGALGFCRRRVIGVRIVGRRIWLLTTLPICCLICRKILPRCGRATHLHRWSILHDAVLWSRAAWRCNLAVLNIRRLVGARLRSRCLRAGVWIRLQPRRPRICVGVIHHRLVGRRVIARWRIFVLKRVIVVGHVDPLPNAIIFLRFYSKRGNSTEWA